MRIILASTSKNRSDLFTKMSIKFEIVSPDYEENIIESMPPVDQIQEFALGKAQSVYEQFKNEENVLIMGFDSMISFEGRSLGKPKTKKAARHQHKKASATAVVKPCLLMPATLAL